MKKNEALTEYFRQARLSRAARDRAIMLSRRARNMNGCLAAVFACIVLFPFIYSYFTGEPYSLSKSAGLGFLVTAFTFNRFGERLAMLSSFEDSPNQSTDPTFSSSTPLAGPEARHP
jgi:hypothetical protein